MHFAWKVCFAAAATVAAFAASKPVAKEYFVYIGSYTNTGKSQGIQLFRFDAQSGKLTPAGLAVATPNPSFVNFHPNGKFLYAVSEMPAQGGAPGGAVSAFSVDRSNGKLTLINTVSSKGSGPCFVRVDATGKVAMVANYGSGSAAALGIKDDGSLAESVSFVQHEGSSVNKQRQSGPHAHSANFSPDNRFVFVADLGLDKLMIYKLDPAKATITANDPPFFSVKPGSGPRHFAFHPNGKWAYVINEMGQTVTAMSYDAKRGAFAELQTVSTIPHEVPGNSTAEVVVHPSGKFLYGSNRGDDSIAVFSIDGTGRLKLLANVPSGGKVPRNFAIDPSGKWLIAAHQNSDNLTVFAIDTKTGSLKSTGQDVSAGAPVCVRFLPIQ